MKVTYKPEGEAEQSWPFRPGRLRQSVASQLQAAYGKPWEVFVAELQGGNIDARRIVLWHCMRSDHPLLKLVDVPDFFAGELLVEYEVDDMRRLLDQAEAVHAPAEQLAAMRAELAEAEAAEVAEAGKASATSGDG